MKIWIPLLAALAIAVPLHAEPVAPPIAQANVMTDGVVRRVDAANGKLTLRHGPIVNLDMPAIPKERARAAIDMRDRCFISVSIARGKCPHTQYCVCSTSLVFNLVQKTRLS